jgi:predicted DNA-binding transcriptional regulator YafY
VDPLGLVSKQTAWYLVARTPEGMRTFRVSRMRDTMVLAIAFERPVGFNLAAYWKRSTEALQEGKQRYKAILGLSPEGVTALAQWVAMKPLEGDGPAVTGGWRAFVVEFDSFYSARFVALGMGASALVIGPEELRRDVREQAAAVAQVAQELS